MWNSTLTLTYLIQHWIEWIKNCMWIFGKLIAYGNQMCLNFGMKERRRKKWTDIHINLLLFSSCLNRLEVFFSLCFIFCVIIWVRERFLASSSYHNDMFHKYFTKYLTFENWIFWMFLKNTVKLPFYYLIQVNNNN